jgi:D-alanyl-D-alanine carboxypeptidase
MKPFSKLFIFALFSAGLLAAGNLLLEARAGGPQTVSEARPSAVITQTPLTDVLLVNASNPLPKGYAPEELVDLYGEKRSFKLASSDIRLAREAFEAANRMFKQSKRDGVDGFILSSGYRTEQEQRSLFDADQDGTAAKPGASEHQTGLAFDVTAYHDGGSFEDTEQFRWLMDHCWDYGFILRYPKGKEDETGIPYEPWHYRYVGVEIAKAIQENGWTLEEYCKRSGG